MIESIAGKWVRWIKANDPEGPGSYDVLYYLARGLLNLIAVFAIALPIGVVTGELPATMAAIASFVLLRIVSGGFHFRNLDICAVATALLLAAVPHVAFWVKPVVLPVNVLSLALVAALAPTNLRNTIWTSKARPAFKTIAIVIVSSNLIVHSPVVAFTFLIQALLLIPGRR